jgi:hypothetical protein
LQLSKLGEYCAAEARLVIDLAAWRPQSRKYMIVIIEIKNKITGITITSKLLL